MKKFIRTVACVLLVVLLSSCAANEVVEIVPGWDISVNEELSFGGAEFHIVDAKSAGNALVFMPDETTILSENLERYVKHVKDIQNTYDCVISVEESDKVEFVKRCISGLNFGNLINFRLKDLYTVWKAGYVVDLNEMPNIDLHSGKYGSDVILDALTWKGETVALYPNWWGTMTPSFSDGLMYNPRLVSQLGLPDPNELHEQGKWNWAALRAMGEAASQTPEGDDKVWLSVLNNYFPRMLMLSNGGRYAVVDSDGKYQFAAASDQAIDAYNFCQELDALGYLTPNADVGANLTKFVEGKLLMIAEYSVQGIIADDGVVGRDMEEAYSWTYAPVGPRGIDTEFGVVSHENQYPAVTVSVQDYDMFGSFMEIFFDKLYDTEDGWRDSYKSMNFFDDASADCFFNKYDNAIFDNVIFMYADDTLFNSILDASRTGHSAVEMIAKIADKAQGGLDVNINN